MAGKKKDNNGADDFAARARNAENPAEWLRAMTDWLNESKAEDERRRAEEDKRRAEREAEEEKRWQAWKKKSDEQEAKLDRIGARLGGWGNVEGELFEMECAEAIRHNEGLAGVHFDHVHTRLRNADIRDTYEYDIVGVNQKETMAVEAKRTLRAADLLRFADERLPAFARLFPNHAKGRKVSGAVIFRRAPLEKTADGETIDPVAIALQKGIIPVQATGKSRLQPITDLNKVRR